ncbi:SDR family oxidoreductase [Bifidobacterium eulemuris]|uniref:NAD-dependent dehydratase n=1 Tax=Bifidobacterium eulemuris TaxID=1765219 RepID=A0A261GCX0_9BIFI|nr:SDR family oxidoreductase [Bifidobacterium eulemuris]OZG69257.1 NAD-dependent dehydratase [Bifidobacterium eulemuris]QOL31237.1 SDR family oxidoreductase [Bifidobacterium eulemuris]
MTIPTRILFVGATGSIGRLAIDEALRQGYHVRALVRDAAQAGLPDEVELAVGDLTRLETFETALDGIDGIVFTQGSHASAAMVEAVDYGAVRNALLALHGRKVRIALMTAIGVTYMDSQYNRTIEAHDWKRRSERLVRASGNEYTIVRPGWFDYNDDDQLRITFLQGDTRRNASPEDGVVARRQIARVLIDALGCDEAANTTLELVAEHGAEQEDLKPLFAALERDPSDGIDGVLDEDNFPLSAQPERVLDDFKAVELVR